MPVGAGRHARARPRMPSAAERTPSAAARLPATRHVADRLARRLLVAGLAALALSTAALPLPVGVAIGGAYALPADVQPPIEKAATDRERPWKDGCLAFESRTVPRNCLYGASDGKFTVALVGDSHLSHFFPAFEAAAKENGWRLRTYLKTNCPFVDMRVRSIVLGREYTECATWNNRVVARINETPPDLVVVAMYVIRPIRRADNKTSRKAQALARMIGKLNSQVVILADSPVSRVDVPVCLDNNRSDIRPCATSRSTALRGHDTVERAAADIAKVRLIDLARDICVADPCPAVVNKMIVFRDFHHLTATFTRSLGPKVARLIKRVAPAAGG